MVLYITFEHKRFAALTGQNSYDVATSTRPRILEATHSGAVDPSTNADYQDSQELFDGILALRDTFASACGYIITYRELAERCCIERHDGKPCIVFNCEGMLFDGLGLPNCKCGGKKLADQYPIVFHGTKDLHGILASNGVMNEAINTADHKMGWYHSTNFKTARWYAEPARMGHSFWKPVLQFRSKCWNRCRAWGYTKTLCKRYSVHKVYLLK